ncbi:MAG: RES family NAD+ phosphorylase [Acidobacteriaceae bacterium]
MILYRVSNHAELTGLGGELADGRWHTCQPGKRIVYLSDHPALCILEMIVHVNEEDEFPKSFQLFSVDVPDGLVDTLDDGLLPDTWQDRSEITQKLGNDWLSGRRSLGLLVPSAVVPIARNCILNPLLPEIDRLRLRLVGRFPFDSRILRRTKDSRYPPL